MGIYHERVLPYIIDAACTCPAVMEARRSIVPRCFGNVLEVGAGSGINFGLYDQSQVTKVWALEPSQGMRRQAMRKQREKVGPEIQWLDLPGEQIPLADCSMDTVLLTYTLCTIDNYQLALKQMLRVLKPNGQLLYCEHGVAPDNGIRRVQDFLTPLWKGLAGGCRLNRPIEDCIMQAGFRIESRENRYLAKLPRFAGFTYSGRAIPAQ